MVLLNYLNMPYSLMFIFELGQLGLQNKPYCARTHPHLAEILNKIRDSPCFAVSKGLPPDACLAMEGRKTGNFFH